jgi:hypothetical protein
LSLGVSGAYAQPRHHRAHQHHHQHHHNNPPGPAGGPGTNWGSNRPGPHGGPGTNWNPPGPVGGPSFGNPPGPAGGPGTNWGGHGAHSDPTATPVSTPSVPSGPGGAIPGGASAQPPVVNAGPKLPGAVKQIEPPPPPIFR